MPNNPIFLILCLGWGILVCFLAPVYGDTARIPVEKLSFNNGKITIEAKNIALKDALRTICDKAGVQLKLNGHFSDRINISVYRQSTDQLLKKLLDRRSFVLIYSQDKDAIQKVYAYDIIGHFKSDVTTISEPLSTEIKDELDWIRYLSSRPEQEAISELSEILSSKEKHLITKQYAIEQLSGFTHNEYAATAIAKGLGDENPEIRSQIINTLGQIEFPSAQQILGQIIFSEREPTLRINALQHLANIDTPASKAFIEAAVKDSDNKVAAEAQYILDSYRY